MATRIQRAVGSEFDSSPLLGDLRVRDENVPDGWTERGNVFLLAAGAEPVRVIGHPGIEPPRNATVVVHAGCTPPITIMVWGENALVVLGPSCQIAGAELFCGGHSSIVLRGETSGGPSNLNARNGGLIYVGKSGLFSTGITMFTDDMHAILDAETGARLNVFGGIVAVDEHVWLGHQALLLPGAHIGRDTVVGARAVVNSRVPAGSVCVGSPARVVRSGVTWSHDDLPPDPTGPNAA